MSERLLVLVRHGQSEWNLKNLFTGWKDPDLTEQGIAEANDGEFEIEEAQGYLAGLPSYFLVGEVMLGKVLLGALPPTSFPKVLRSAASARWYAVADSSLWEADFCARRAESVTCAGLLAKAAIAAAQARLAKRGEWVFNEKRILAWANVVGAEAVLADGVGATSQRLKRAVSEMRAALGR